MASGAGPYAVTWVRSTREVPDDLWRCLPPGVEGRWWYETLEDCGLEDQFEFFYGVVTAGHRPVGVAPAFVMEVPIRLVAPDELLPVLNLLGRVFPRILYQRTLFVGSPCSDEGAVGLAPDVDRRLAFREVNRSIQTLADRLKAPMRVWKDVPAGAESDLAPLAADRSLFPMVSFPGTMVKFPDPTKASYFDTLKSSRRNKLKKKLKSSSEAPLDLTILDTPTAAEIDEIFELFMKTYDKGKTKFERLNRTFFERISKVQESSFIVIRERAEGGMVAFMLCFTVEDRIINKFIGIDYETPKDWFLYFRLWDAVVDLAVGKGIASVQSGQTGYSAKIETGHALEPMTNYVRHKNPIVHWIYKAVAKSINWETLDEDLAVFLKAYPDHRPGNGG